MIISDWKANHNQHRCPSALGYQAPARLSRILDQYTGSCQSAVSSCLSRKSQIEP
jgi:hypothetical protein